ncbi:MAG: acyltransferase [Armatimonadetes bacterium]|nr:acyltransferase [Armatimonadota bacterium]
MEAESQITPGAQPEADSQTEGRQSRSGARPHYPLFNWIRLFLALEVVWLHTPIAHRGDQNLILPIDPVPAFIAISGFLVFQSLQRTPNLGAFWRNRALRVLPAFFLALVVTYAVNGMPALRDSLLSYVRMIPVNTTPGANYALWSLSVEEILYGLMVLFTVLGLYRVRHFHRGFFWVAFCLLSVFSVLLFTVFRLSHPLDGGPTGFAVGASFAAGTYMADSEYLPVVRRYWWVFIGASVAGAGLFFQLPMGWLRGVLFVLMVVGGSLGVLGLGTMDVKVPKLNNDLSYGLYVLHLPMLSLCDKWALTGPRFIATGFGLSLAAAAVSWFCLERPMLSLKAKSATTDSG